MNLSQHFTLAEAKRSMAATRHGIDNDPKGDVIINRLEQTALHILEPIRTHFGIPFSPSSWYRHPRLNAVLGGSSQSQHCLGRAVDIELPGVPNIELGLWIEDNLKFDQLIYEYLRHDDPSAGWIHVSYTADHNRQDIRLKNKRQHHTSIETGRRLFHGDPPST